MYEWVLKMAALCGPYADDNKTRLGNVQTNLCNLADML